MQWQKVKNVNPPPNQILMIWSGYGVGFAYRFTNKKKQDIIQISDNYIELIEDGEYKEKLFNQFKLTDKDSYWCIFHEPEGN